MKGVGKGNQVCSLMEQFFEPPSQVEAIDRRGGTGRMTAEEIETHRQRLQEILAEGKSSGLDERAVRKKLQELAIKVGASTTVFYVGTQKEKPQLEDAPAPTLAGNIHQALQTASMIDACRTAARNHEIALKAQRSAWLSQCTSVAAMSAAVATAIAAWLWH
jgi:hypothetical protein